MGKKGFTIVELVIVFAIVIGIIFCFYPFISKIPYNSEMVMCGNNLRELGKALYVYARNNGGKFPNSLKTLYDEEYIADWGIVDCPATRQKGTPDYPEYNYSPGLNVNDDSGAVLLTDKSGSHKYGENKLLLNGTIISSARS